MKNREATLRSLRFDVEEKSRKVQDLQMMIRDLEMAELDLKRQIATEEERSGIKDPAHYAYSTFAKAAAQRRENIVTSIDDLSQRLVDAETQHDDANRELEAAESANLRQVDRGRRTTAQTTSDTPAASYSDH